MGRQPTTGLTWADLQRYPDDGLRRELIDGELFVTPSPSTRHQRTVVQLAYRLEAFAKAHGGLVLVAPYDVKFNESNVVEPDVLFIVDAARVGPDRLYEAPDLAVEISSPSTKRTDRVRKRALYERFGVAEYWIVDLDEDVIQAYVLRGGQYGDPAVFGPGDVVTATAVPGFAQPFDELVAL